MSWQRDELRTNRDPFASEWANCADCMRRCGAAVRATLGCGWLPESERTGAMAPPASPDATVCVGYTTSLPEVLEASRALAWRQDGLLRDLYDGEPITQAVRDCMDILGCEIRRVEKYAMTPKDER